MWDFPDPGFEPVSPALAGGFLTTVPPGKSLSAILIKTPMTFFTEIEKKNPKISSQPPKTPNSHSTS